VKRWTAVTIVNENTRWINLSQKLKEAGVDNEFVPWTGSPENLPTLEELQDFHHVRLSSRLGLRLVPTLKIQSAWTTSLGVIDGMVQGGGTWWPFCALYEAICQILIECGQGLDTKGKVMLAGAGAAARVAVPAFFKSGFQHVLVTNADREEAMTMMADVRRRFFGLTLEYVPMEKIVLLPGESSVLINCTPWVEDNPLFHELSYLNFLKRPGYLFDLSRQEGDVINPLVREAQDAGLNVVMGSEIARRSDLLWAKWAFQVDLDPSRYQL